MRFVLSVALKYLLPRQRQLSLSIISCVSVLVISLVVWLCLVFLSVTHGIEKKWLEELVAINAPVRMTPTENYYNSYYNLIDQYSDKSNYATKSLGEKLVTELADPYDPSFDAELPSHFPQALKNPDGSVKDLAKEGWMAINGLTQFSGLRSSEYEVSFGNLELDLLRMENGGMNKSFLTQLSYISAFDTENNRLKQMILPPENDDLNNLSFRLTQAGEKKQLSTYLVHGNDHIPSHHILGQGILVSKHFQKNGVQIGDSGHIAYYAPSGGSMKEQKIPVYVAGFYDPGLMPVGGKVLFTDPALLSTLRNTSRIADNMLGNGFQIFPKGIQEAEEVKNALVAALKARGLDSFFKVESYSDYEFAKPILDQLKSDKTLFTLISMIILIVACSNIISMLILLVNDKKKEIGILQSMGVTTKQIASIFGLCGFMTGVIASIVGLGAALLTLHNLQSLVNLLSFFQGREAFQAAFYGSGLPNELSLSALVFVLISTIIISLLAGIVPAMKAAKIKPAVILRSDG